MSVHSSVNLYIHVQYAEASEKATGLKIIFIEFPVTMTGLVSLVFVMYHFWSVKYFMNK